MNKLIKLILTICLTQGIIQCSKSKVVGPNRNVSLIAVAEWDNTFKTHIFTMSPDGKNKKQLTSGQTEYWMPVWSPDGKKIAYVSRLSTGMNIHVMDADGTNPQQLTSTGTNMAPSWSPDGAKIAFAHNEPGAMPLDIWLMNADGTNKKALTTTSVIVDNNVPAWSADGQKIAFTSNRNGGQCQIWTINLIDSTFTQLTTAWFYSIIGQWIEQKVPAWSPDGKYIAYWQGVEGSNSTTNMPWNVCVMLADGTNKRLVAPGDDPSWSPDSKTIIHVWKTDCPASVSIGGISPDGSNQRLVFQTNCGFGRMSWQPVK